MKRIAVVLSGCGHKDGSEITEAVSTLICLSEAGVHYEVFAPDTTFTPTDHLSGAPGEKRNILAEAARIARGEIKPLAHLKAKDFDGLVFPGGYGAALHLCTFAKEGAKGKVLPELKTLIEDFHKSHKPICAICIAPALIAMVLGRNKITVTLGEAGETAAEVVKTGALHEPCKVTDYVSDRDHKIVTTPAYMYDATPFQAFQGIRGAIREFVEMA